MSDLQPMNYATPVPSSADDGHLRALAICHYIWGGLTIAFASFFIIYIVIGALITSGAIPVNGTVIRNGRATTFPTSSYVSPSGGSIVVSSPPAAPMPNWMGYFFIGMGSVAVLLGWTVGILTILSGRWITTRRRRIFTLVMAGINCASFPFGTVLGVFTFVILLRPSVKQMYEFRAG